MKIRIVLLPDDKSWNLVKKYSSLIADKYPSYFRLDSSHTPHATLTSPEFEDELFSKIKDLVGGLTRETDKITLTVNQIKNGGRGFIGVYFENDTEIDGLREKLIALLKPYNKEGSLVRVSHVTLTRLQSEGTVPEAIESIHNFPKVHFSFDYLAICEGGENGTCKSIIVKFPLTEQNPLEPIEPRDNLKR